MTSTQDQIVLHIVEQKQQLIEDYGQMNYLT